MIRAFTFVMSFLGATIFANEPILEVKDWFAFGSGCRGRANNIGDVRMEVIKDKNVKNRYQLIFSMGSYSLNGEDPVNKEKPTFARECSLRYSAYPKPFYKVKRVKVETDFILTKAKGAKASFRARLMTGAGSLGDWRKEYTEKDTIKEKSLSVSLSPDKNGNRLLSSNNCGDPKIIGADLTLLNKRKSFKEKIKMTHGKRNKLTFTLDLEPCGKKNFLAKSL